jgi:hypothetical protein
MSAPVNERPITCSVCGKNAAYGAAVACMACKTKTYCSRGCARDNGVSLKHECEFLARMELGAFAVSTAESAVATAPASGEIMRAAFGATGARELDDLPVLVLDVRALHQGHDPNRRARFTEWPIVFVPDAIYFTSVDGSGTKGDDCADRVSQYLRAKLGIPEGDARCGYARRLMTTYVRRFFARICRQTRAAWRMLDDGDVESSRPDGREPCDEDYSSGYEEEEYDADETETTTTTPPTSRATIPRKMADKSEEMSTTMTVPLGMGRQRAIICRLVRHPTLLRLCCSAATLRKLHPRPMESTDRAELLFRILLHRGER